MTYHVLLNKDGEGISKAMITNSWLEILGVTQEQLHQDALNNSQKLFPLSVMTITQAVMGGYRSNRSVCIITGKPGRSVER